MKEIVNNIFSQNTFDFQELAIRVFQNQYLYNCVYQAWTDALSIDPLTVKTINEIPFLPVSFFKDHPVTTGDFIPQIVFASSGTTQTATSSHYVKDLALYEKSFTRGFQLFYGDVSEWCIIGLLPSYLERHGSSLVTMVDKLIKLSNHAQSGFYLYDFNKLAAVIEQLETLGQKTMIIGVTFALLDFAAAHPMKLKHTVIMETGGMKGRKREMIRREVHEILKTQLGITEVHSEYGMTELLSQAYSKGEGTYKTVPWMKVLVREEDDPLKVSGSGRGILNIIDLANIDSCSFIATDDAGVVYEDNTFEVVGRMDASDVRGCSLLVV